MDLKTFYERLEHLHQQTHELSEDVADSECEIVGSYQNDVDDLLFEVQTSLNALKAFHSTQLKLAGVEFE